MQQAIKESQSMVKEWAQYAVACKAQGSDYYDYPLWFAMSYKLSNHSDLKTTPQK